MNIPMDMLSMRCDYRYHRPTRLVIAVFLFATSLTSYGSQGAATHAATGQLGLADTNIPETTIEQSQLDAEMTSINAWRIIGPIPLKHQTYSNVDEGNAIGTDELRGIGGREMPLALPKQQTQEPISFSQDIYDETSITGSPNGIFLSQNVTFPGSVVASQYLFWRSFEVFKVMYAVSKITSNRDQDVALLISGNSPVKVWLNDEVVVAPRGGTVGHDMDLLAVAVVHLKRGKNQLVVKEFCFPLRNNFVARLCTLRRLDEFAKEHKGIEDVLDRIIVKPEEGLLFSANLRSFVDGPTNIRVTDLRGHVIKTARMDLRKQLRYPTASLRIGIYSAHVHTRLGWASEHFFVGTTGQLIKHYRASCSEKNEGDLGYDPCIIMDPLAAVAGDSDVAQTRRLDHDKQILTLASQLEWNLARVTPEKVIFDEPRFQLMSVALQDRSREQFFYLFLPSQRPGQDKVPLTVMLASHPEKHPFLRSGPTMSIDALRRYAFHADQLGYAVIVPFLREPTESAETSQQVLLLIRYIQKHYNTDPDRVYISGDCEEGRTALLTAERSPHTFAAIAVGRPSTGVLTRLTRTAAIDQVNPLLSLRNISHIPIITVHGDYFPHSPTVQSLILREQAALAGGNVQVVLLPRDGELAVEDMMSLEYTFFRGKRRTDSRR